MLMKKVAENWKELSRKQFDLTYANDVPVQKIHILKCKINTKWGQKLCNESLKQIKAKSNSISNS